MRIVDEDFREILASQIISIIGGLIAGTILAAYTKQIFLIPGMLIIFPGFLEMRNGISGSLTARISAGLHLGIVKPSGRETKLIKGNVFAAFLLALVVSLALGLLAFAVSSLFFGAVTYRIIAIPIIAGVISSLVEIPVTVFFTFYTFRAGYDPDDVMGPFITSLGDIISIISLLLAIAVI